MSRTLRQAAQWSRSAARRLERQAWKAVEETRDDVLQTAAVLSSGPVSSAELAQQDHPFARRHPAPATPELINAQSGQFRSSWESTGPRETRGGITATVFNTAPYAKYLQSGTHTMWSRPIVDAVVLDVAPRFAARLKLAVELATGP